jgi:hypothetical protein
VKNGVDLDLRHYAGSPVTLEPRRYEQRPDLKPAGFWVSVGSGWADWCEGEEFRTENLVHTYRVRLVPDANVLTIGDVDGLDGFTDTHQLDRYHLDWPKVAANHQGVVIAPYQWSRRFEHLWYYGWDCASGCIWDLSAIADVTVLELT